MKKKRLSLFFVFAILAIPTIHASSGGTSIEQANIVIQIGILLFAVKLGSAIAKRVGIPGVLGELIMGIIIGPFALGGIALPGFPHGIFGTGIPDAQIPVRMELYTFSTIASIILLFKSGLETDLGLFLKYSVAGIVVGIGGVVATFFGGAIVGMLVLGGEFMDSHNLMLGIMATATSIGITARILSEKKKLDTPEGVTILAAAVFDDVLGIVLLAVVLGITNARTASGGELAWGSIGKIAFKAFGLWLLFTALGLAFSKRISAILKRFRHASLFTVLAVGMALLLAGFFEREGLAMIIGAYVMGLSLSKSDIGHIIIDKMAVLYEFFVPIFFAIMGMMVDTRQFLSMDTLIAGGAFTAIAILGKVIGCGGPALLTGFNFKGALRIGIGMVPRGEVVLILAGIGLSSGLLPKSLFGVAVLMPLITATLTPPVLGKVLSIPGRGTRKENPHADTAAINFSFPSIDIANLVNDTMERQLLEEGFFVRTMDVEEGIAQVRKDDIAFSVELKGSSLEVQGPIKDIPVAQTVMFEAVASLNSSFTKLKSDFEPASMSVKIPSARPETNIRQEKARHGNARHANARHLVPSCISLNLKSETKEGAIDELINLLVSSGKLKDKNAAFDAIMEREASMSTGMQRGIALPHAKVSGVKKLVVALGLKPGGLDFASLDGTPTEVILLILSPRDMPGSHLQFLAKAGAILRDDEIRARLMAAKKEKEIVEILGL